jgi:hypothetical protein
MSQACAASAHPMTESPLKATEPPNTSLGNPSPAAADNALPTAVPTRTVWDRIKHHKVVQWTLAYLALAYTLLHSAEMLGNSLGWSHGLLRLFTLILILGVPISDHACLVSRRAQAATSERHGTNNYRNLVGHRRNLLVAGQRYGA